MEVTHDIFVLMDLETGKINLTFITSHHLQISENPPE